jgi:hypothetical protein
MGLGIGTFAVNTFGLVTSNWYSTMLQGPVILFVGV